MSEFQVIVRTLGPVYKHEQADKLSYTYIGGEDGYRVVMSTDEAWKEGDLAVYVPVGSVVPADDPRWRHLLPKGSAPPPPGIEIEAKRFRGKYSMGTITRPDPSWVEGQDVHAELRIVRADPPEPDVGNERDPGLLPVYTDMLSLRQWPDPFLDGEVVVVTEKVHGECGRFVYDPTQKRLYCGSRTYWKDPAGGPAGGVPGAPLRQHAWWEVARRLGLEQRLRDMPDIGIYGEVYGDAATMPYDADPLTRGLRIFDAVDVRSRSYLDFDDVVEVARQLGVPAVPVLYRGPWSRELRSHAEGKSMLAGHVREGAVYRPAKERYDVTRGRVIVKLHGQDFHLAKKKRK